VLRAQGSVFAESLQVGLDEIYYAIAPENHGDYLAIIEALASMGAHRISLGGIEPIDFVNPQPDAPAFFLSIPLVN
jgi:hypothetical protein